MELVLILVAAALRLGGGAGYALAVVRGRARPNPVTWFCWALAPLVAFAAQAQDGLDPRAWMTLVLALGPLTIFATSVLRGRSLGNVTRFDLACGGLALLGIVAWQVTSNPAVALGFAIAADLAGAAPTLRCAYRRPRAEYPLPYLLSAVSMVVVLLTVADWQFVQYAFPVYILAINATIFGVVTLRGTGPLRQPVYVPFLERRVDLEYDVDGAPLDGGRHYVLRVSALPRARLAWSVTARTDEASSSVRDAADVYFGPSRPPGADGNWIRTVPGEAWSATFHVYGPGHDAFDRSWALDALTPVG